MRNNAKPLAWLMSSLPRSRTTSRGSERPSVARRTTSIRISKPVSPFTLSIGWCSPGCSRLSRSRICQSATGGNLAMWAFMRTQLNASILLHHVVLTAGKIHPQFGLAWDVTPGLHGTDVAETYELKERDGGNVAYPTRHPRHRARSECQRFHGRPDAAQRFAPHQPRIVEDR